MEEPHDRGMIFEAAVLKYLHQLAVAEPVQRLEADAEILFQVLAAYIRVRCARGSRRALSAPSA